MQITVIDYGVGNVGSIVNMIKRIGASALVTSDPNEIEGAAKLILPGVGAFDQGMRKLRERALIEPLNRAVLEKKTPILGICLGLQLFTKGSEEGSETGLGWFEAMTKRFSFNEPQSLKVPHMGWNRLTPAKASPLFSNLSYDARFYFVHSFHIADARKDDVIATAQYGYEFAASLGRDHIAGVQFHPEKSHKYGMHLLRNFVERY